MKHLLSDLDVALVSGASRYPAKAPFDAPAAYAEYPHGGGRVDPANAVYPMVREAFRLLSMDEPNFGRPAWNPLGKLISRGQRVLIKPNFVLHFNAGGGPLEAVVTHPSVIRAVVDYVMIALQGEGEIIIGDAPQMNCDLATLYNVSGMDGLIAFLSEACAARGIKFSALDFRQEQTFYKYGIVWKRKPLVAASRPVRVSVGRDSFMEAIDSTRLYGADYCRSETVAAHRNHHHEYVIAHAALASDVVISVPKLKVHRKVGTTLNLKNMVGINADKNHLAHYRTGSPREGGDEFAEPRWDDKAERRLTDLLLGTNWQVGKYPFLIWRAFRKLYDRLNKTGARPAATYGNWHGNDTAWRMVLDLNRVLMFADREGRLRAEPQRRYLSVIDGVVGGEGEGPLHPEAYESGVVLAGLNPLAVDWVGTRLMGFDPARIALYINAVEQMRDWVPGFKVEACRVLTNAREWQNVLNSDEVIFKFRAPRGWRGTVERYESVDEPVEPVAGPVGAISQ
ncbi:MAG TPA: DUF362 domain-containing protein [Blastocatellia bacterium]